MSSRLMPLCLMLLMITVSQARANTNDTYNMTMNITGTVVANGSCTFNQGGTLDVDFGAVKFKDGGNNTLLLDSDYTKPLTSSFTCTGDTQGLLQMKLTRNNNAYYTYQGIDIINISAYSLGIVGVELLVNGSPQNMDEWFNIDPANEPNLQLKLVQPTTTNSNSIANGDTFSASATLTMAFN